MKITTSKRTVNYKRHLIASFDVSKHSLSFYSQHAGRANTRHFQKDLPNTTTASSPNR